ncbi:MAG: tetratricopeptide repeat protein, partial [Candidatus Eisenbacteria bacterium]|nr:tetratricopeptide repeat protein [Candidatus Eisenbacteria bacterium]
ALCERLLGRNDEARQGLDQYRHEFPGDARAADVAYQLGDLDDIAGHPSDAAKSFEEALACHPSRALAVEIGYRLGRVREQLGDTDGALAAYQRAADGPDRDQAFRLSAVARCAALYEARKDFARALTAYRDIARNAKDPELVAAATNRVSRLEAGARKR